MNMELLDKLKQVAYRGWKQGKRQSGINTVKWYQKPRICLGLIYQQKQMQPRASQLREKAPSGAIAIKERLGKNAGPVKKDTGDLVTQDMKKTEVVNDFFASVFTSKCSSHIAKVVEGEIKDLENETLSAVEKE